MDTNSYYREAIECALDESGVDWRSVITDSILDDVALSVVNAIECESLAFPSPSTCGYDMEIDELKRELANERNRTEKVQKDAGIAAARLKGLNPNIHNVHLDGQDFVVSR